MYCMNVVSLSIYTTVHISKITIQNKFTKKCRHNLSKQLTKALKQIPYMLKKSKQIPLPPQLHQSIMEHCLKFFAEWMRKRVNNKNWKWIENLWYQLKLTLTTWLLKYPDVWYIFMVKVRNVYNCNYFRKEKRFRVTFFFKILDIYTCSTGRCKKHIFISGQLQLLIFGWKFAWSNSLTNIIF